MCNLYVPPSYERLGKPNMKGLWGTYVAPLKPGPYMRGNGDITVGQWGMIPPGCKTRVPAAPNGVRLSTNNARREGLAVAKTFKGPWLAGQRCLIPAESFQEPYYPPESAKSIAWQFQRADGELWALAGLYAEWIEPETGDIVQSYLDHAKLRRPPAARANAQTRSGQGHQRGAASRQAGQAGRGAH